MGRIIHDILTIINAKTELFEQHVDPLLLMHETLHMNTKQMGTGHQGIQLGPGPTQTSERLTELPLAPILAAQTMMLMPAFRPLLTRGKPIVRQLKLCSSSAQNNASRQRQDRAIGDLGSSIQ